jgi:hypothetical protein
MLRRLVIVAALAVLAALVAHVAMSSASFTTASTTKVRAATAPLSSDTLALRAGDTQTAFAGSAVATAPSVRVSDARGNPVSGVAVTFAVTAGGGSVAGPSTTTGDDGIATAGGWTLGPAAGLNTLSATATGVPGSVTFSATGTSRTPARVSLNAGDAQWATVGNAVAVAPSVLVTDAGGSPVSGVAVTFAVTSGGGSVTGSAATTNPSGIATAGGWTLGTATGANTLTATASGLTGSPLTFTATATPAAASKYLVTSSTYAPVAGGAATVSAQLADQYGNPVPTSGIQVTWTRTGTGGSLTSTSTTLSTGIATATLTTATTAGTTYTVTATSTSPSTRTGTSSSITSVAGPAAKISISAGGTTQSATVNTAVATDPAVLVQDANNNAVSGYPVTFVVASGGGTLAGETPVTNASGVAAVTSWTLGTTAGTNTVTVTANGLSGSPLTFTATGNAAAASRYVVTSSSYSPVAGAAVTISAQLADTYGNAVRTSGLSVTWSKTGSGGSLTSSSTTLATGIATATLTTATAAGNSYTVTATSTSPSTRTGSSTAIATVAGAATRMSISAGGTTQSAVAGAAVVTDPAVLVQDANNNPVAGYAVTFAASGTGVVTPTTVTTNASGIAAVDSWTLSKTVGANTLTATGSGLSGSPITFNATGVVGPVAKVTVNGGNGQSATVGATLGTDPSVLVTDANDNPVSGATVTFAVASGGGSVSGATQATGGTGIATVTSWKLGTLVGANTLTATSNGVSTTFTATGVAGAASKYVVTIDDSTPAAGQTVTLTAQLTDTYGNPVATTGLNVTWSRTSGSGGSFSDSTTSTDSNGVTTTTFTVSTGSARTYTIRAQSTSPSTRTGTITFSTH